jgi:hypothetical protein
VLVRLRPTPSCGAAETGLEFLGREAQALFDREGTRALLAPFDVVDAVEAVLGADLVRGAEVETVMRFGIGEVAPDFSAVGIPGDPDREGRPRVPRDRRMSGPTPGAGIPVARRAEGPRPRPRRRARRKELLDVRALRKPFHADADFQEDPVSRFGEYRWQYIKALLAKHRGGTRCSCLAREKST